MSNLAKLPAALDMIQSRIDDLSPDQMHNAMIKVCNDIAPCFGNGWTAFRTWHFEHKPDGKTVTVYDPCTRDQLCAMVADKRAMLAAHPYVVTK